MRPKQKEMDEIVRNIFEAMKGKEHLESTLLVLCGDHGMNEGGNHGGAGEGETSPALTFLSPKFASVSGGFSSPLIVPSSGVFQYYDAVEQSDIAPTLAALLGFPVPLNNLGVLIRQTLAFWPEGTLSNCGTSVCSQKPCRAANPSDASKCTPDPQNCSEHFPAIEFDWP